MLESFTNPIRSPSGEKNGPRAPSLPSTTIVSYPSSDLSINGESTSPAEVAICRPSGDIATWETSLIDEPAVKTAGCSRCIERNVGRVKPCSCAFSFDGLLDPPKNIPSTTAAISAVIQPIQRKEFGFAKVERRLVEILLAPPPLEISSRSSLTKPASVSRSSTSFCKHRSSNLRMAGGVSLGIAFQFGSRSKMFTNVSDRLSPPYARSPVSISKIMHPNAQISVRLSTTRPRACSGLMYAGVPSI